MCMPAGACVCVREIETDLHFFGFQKFFMSHQSNTTFILHESENGHTLHYSIHQGGA